MFSIWTKIILSHWRKENHKWMEKFTQKKKKIIKFSMKKK